MTEDEMVGWHHRLNAPGFGWTLGVCDGQGGLACCSSWGHKDSDTRVTELNWTEHLPCLANKHIVTCSCFNYYWIVMLNLMPWRSLQDTKLNYTSQFDNKFSSYLIESPFFLCRNWAAEIVVFCQDALRKLGQSYDQKKPISLPRKKQSHNDFILLKWILLDFKIWEEFPNM